jgi:hypothetical protein
VEKASKEEWVHVTAAGKGTILESTGKHTKFADDDVEVPGTVAEAKTEADDVHMT